MTFYKELKEALNNEGEGAFVLVQKDNEMYCIFSLTKDIWGNYRNSGWWMTKEHAKKYIDICLGYTSTIINKRAKEENWEIIKTYPVRD